MFKITQKLAILAFLLFFILVEFVFQSQMEALWTYSIYAFEVFFLALYFYIFGGIKFFKEKLKYRGKLVLAGTLAFGLLTRLSCRFLNLTVPFDFHSTEVLIFLLALGPILEELVFRGFFSGAIHTFAKHPLAIALGTAICFSMAHFYPYFQVPIEFHSFIIYQTFYTFLLGLICAYFSLVNGMTFAILAHFLFNLAFFAAGFL